MSKDTDSPNTNSSTANSKTNKSQETVTFALAQSHFLVGDITANAEKMRTLALQAREQGADVIIFPELALLGYPPQDLLCITRLPTTRFATTSKLVRPCQKRPL